MPTSHEPVKGMINKLDRKAQPRMTRHPVGEKGVDKRRAQSAAKATMHYASSEAMGNQMSSMKRREEKKKTSRRSKISNRGK